MKPAPLLRATALLLAAVLAACSSGGFETWTDVESARVTVQQAGVPPPGGEPETTRYTSGGEIDEITQALNDNQIAERDLSRMNEGCTGGTEVEIRVVQDNGIVTSMHAYLCAGEQFGGVDGDVEGLLADLGI